MSDPLDIVAQYESGNRNVPNYKYGPGFTAGGYFQITDSNWRKLAPRLGVSYANAMAAPYDVQRQAASLLRSDDLARGGTGYGDWAPYNPRLASALGQPNAALGDSPGRIVVPPAQTTERPFLAAFLAGLPAGGQAPEPEPGREGRDLPLLTALLGPLGAPQASGTPPGATQAQPEPIEAPVAPLPAENTIAGATLPTQPMTGLDGLLASMPQVPQPAAPNPREFIEPPGRGQALPQPITPSAPVIGGGPVGPPARAENQASLLDQLVAGAREVGQTALGLGERAVLGAENIGNLAQGKPVRRGEIPVMPGVGRLADAATFATGGLMSPVAGELSAAGGAARAAAREAAPAMRSAFREQTGAVPLPAAVSDALAKAHKTINEIFSPTTVDPFSREAETLIRQSGGMARRDTEIANAALEPYRPLVNAHVPEFDAWMQARKAGTLPAGAGDPALLRFLNFVEGRSSGAAYAGPPELRDLADTMRRIYAKRRAAIAAEPTTAGAGSIEDYYSHAWQEHEQVRRALAAGGQGSGRSLKKRTIPTISEGIERGFTPTTLDPIEATMRYVANMDRYLAHNRVFRIGRESGVIRFAAPNAEPEGWAPLIGRVAEHGIDKAYAPEAFARVYNNAVSSGVYQDRLGGQIYNAVLKTKNTINSFVLGLSLFHATAMAQEASASGFSSLLGGIGKADTEWVAKQLGLAGMPIAKSIEDVARRGRRLQRQYAEVQDYGPEYEKIAKLLAEGGGRILGRGQEWRGTAAANFFQSWKRGALRIEGLAAGRELRDNPLRLPLVAARELARLNDTIMAPIFDGMIPRLKAAAFYDEMKTWLDANPLASKTEQLAMSRRIVDVVDDRFGEMILDNIFWGKRTKQFLQIATTSLGWELGTLRSGLGAAADVARGDVWSPRVRYLIGLAGSVALYNASYQYLMTGKAPDLGDRSGPLGIPMDLVAPRTGGKTPEGVPERALLPGYEKDALGWWHNPTTEFMNKLSPFGRLTGEVVTGKDYFGREIAPFAPGTPDWFKAYAKHIEQAFVPIPLKQDTLKGTAIGGGQRAMGVRQAPEYLQNPQRYDDMQTRRRLNELRGQLRGLELHGRRTTQDPAERKKQADDIKRQIDETVRAYKERGAGRKPRDLRHSTGAE